jgi:ESAT-6 family protein
MATPKTRLSVEAVDAMIQKAHNLLAEAQALGQQYVAHSHDIAGVGWSGDAMMTSTMVSEHVNGQLGQMVAHTTELHEQLNAHKNNTIAQEADAQHALQAVQPGGISST